MNCWEILGIDPTHDRAAIERAYERQKKFAEGDDLKRLQQAFREASGEAPESSRSEPQSNGREENQPERQQQSGQAELSAEDRQVVREVVIQVKALLNDSRRSADPGIWKAILTESPADQPHIRAEVAQALEPQLRPMAENGSFPSPVVAFLGDWFGWQELQDAGRQAPAIENPQGSESSAREAGQEGENQPPTTSFWPAVVGWIVALAVLAAFFDSMMGG